MKLKVSKRSGASKAELNAIRLEGNIPAVLYHAGQKGEMFVVDGKQFDTVMRTMKKGHLPTTIFELEGDLSGIRAIVKEVQYHPTTYQVLHLDLMQLVDDRKIDINVPVDFRGVADCIGIKLGGFLREVTRHLRVRCLPKDIPTQFELDVRKLGIKQSLRAKDITFPKGVESLASSNEVIVTIAKK